MTTAGTDQPARRSPLAMAVLLLLTHEPTHPYGLRQRIQEWDKDRVINVTQRNAVYQTVDRLRRSGLIRLREMARQENRPERAVYEATEAGTQLARTWLREMLAKRTPEYPSFPAALAFLQSLDHDTVTTALEQRVAALEADVGALRSEVEARVALVPGGVDRIHLVEVEYQVAMWDAEIRWIRTLLEDLHAGRAWADGQVDDIVS
jgi:DNA-binding PadR family transcriptional regulator